jgi:hypothetical protein
LLGFYRLLTSISDWSRQSLDCLSQGGANSCIYQELFDLLQVDDNRRARVDPAAKQSAEGISLLSGQMLKRDHTLQWASPFQTSDQFGE